MAGDAGPWWASGADDIDVSTDPLEAHQAARRAEGAGGADRTVGDDRVGGGRGAAGGAGSRPYDIPWQDWDRRDAPPPPSATRSSLEDALEGLQALARAVAARRDLVRGERGGAGAVHDPACRGCPWCTVVRALSESRPEVAEHLEEAMRHLVAAARAWVDAAESRGGWERIELDDDPEAGQ